MMDLPVLARRPCRCSGSAAVDDGRAALAAHGILNVVAALGAILETVMDGSIEVPAHERALLHRDARAGLARLDETLRLVVLGVGAVEAWELETVA